MNAVSYTEINHNGFRAQGHMVKVSYFYIFIKLKKIDLAFNYGVVEDALNYCKFKQKNTNLIVSI